MGMYTGLRFKGIVKEEYRDKFYDIAMYGEWNKSELLEFRIFGNIGRSSFIPCGSLAYMPDEWETEPYDEWYNGVPADGFDRTYDEKTGRWTFQCSLKNYEDEIEQFFELIPIFIESIEHCEYYYEEWEYSRKYELIDDEVICTDDKFIKYCPY